MAGRRSEPSEREPAEREPAEREPAGREHAERDGDRDIELGSAELEALKVLWDDGPCTVRQVLGAMHARGRRVAYTTVLTFPTRLEQKGCVTSDRSGMAYVYRPLVSRERVTTSRLESLLEELYDGAAGPLVLQLVQRGEFTSDEIRQLQRLIDDLDEAGEPAPKRTRRSRRPGSARGSRTSRGRTPGKPPGKTPGQGEGS